MKYKKDGFVSIECIISLSIISLAVYIISTSLYSNYVIVNTNKEQVEMLNLAKSNLELTKHQIKKSSSEIIENTKNTKIVNSYEISTIIEKDIYYECHKVNVKVKNDKNNISLYSYVFKQ
ncbi:hypothetical protein [Faecalimicrobium dakarense]|uniref:hypothetical protein n=1 Tax=Faecalimicrobium dakarense TaxID=1301100 RepID=UPI0004BC1243|nr:hypothetical protein [[Clostridium] dakarense]